MEIKYNTNRELSTYQESIDIIRKHGFNVIAVAQMYFEDTFAFETAEEAKKAYHALERDEDEKWIGKACGWWNSREEFLNHIKEYEEAEGAISKVKIYWL